MTTSAGAGRLYPMSRFRQYGGQGAQRRGWPNCKAIRANEPAMITTDSTARSVPEVLAGASLGFAFRHEVSKERSGGQAADVSRVIDGKEKAKDRNVNHPAPKLPTIFLAQGDHDGSWRRSGRRSTRGSRPKPPRTSRGAPPKAQEESRHPRNQIEHHELGSRKQRLNFRTKVEKAPEVEPDVQQPGVQEDRRHKSPPLPDQDVRTLGAEAQQHLAADAAHGRHRVELGRR